MKDLWMVEEVRKDSQDNFFIFSSEKGAKQSMDEGDHLYKIPAESPIYMGTLSTVLVK